jgi:hypothetical protein
MVLRILHQRIEDSLNRVRLERDGPVFLIEHGLSTAEVEELGRALREDAVVGDNGHRSLRPLSGSWWNSRIYGLLVFMTEVGYSYGENRVFWPTLAEKLRLRAIDDDLRRGLVEQFELANDVPRPPHTPWADNFGLIAWPISNAVLPRWLHAELLNLLLRCPFPIDDRGRHLPWLHQAAASKARRLLLLLNPERAVQAAALIAAIVDGDVGVRGALSEAFVQRVKADMMSAPEVRRLRAMVAQAQVRLRPVEPRRRPAAARAVDAGRLQVLLVLQPGQRALRVAPVAHGALSASPLDRVRAVTLGGRRFVSLGRLLREGGEVERLPAPADAVRLVDETLPTKVLGHAGLVIESLFLDLRDPILFSSQGRLAAAVQVVERAYGSGPGWWALTKEVLPSDGPRTDGTVCGWTLVDLSADEVAARAWLDARGVVSREVARVRAVGPPPLFSSDGWSFRVGDVVAIRVEGAPVQIESAGASQRLEIGAHLIPGELDGRVAVAERVHADRPIRMVRSAARDPMVGPLVVLEPVGATSVDLRRGRVSLSTAGALSLAGLPISLTSHCGEERRTLRSTLPASGRLDEDAPEWEALRRALPESGDVLVSVDVGGLGFERWLFPSVDDGMEETAASSDFGEPQGTIEESWYFAEDPLRASSKPNDGAHLHLQRWGEVRRAVVWAPPRMVLGSSPPTPGPVPRMAQEVESLLRGLGLWRGAAASDLLAGWTRAEVVRGLDRVSVRAICGRVWADAELALPRGRCAEAAAAALMVPGVGWTESDEVDPHRARRAQRRFADLLEAEGLDAVRHGEACHMWAAERTEALSWQLERALAEHGVPNVDVLMDPAEVGRVLDDIVGARAEALARGLGWLITPRSLEQRLVGLVDVSSDLDDCAELTSRLLAGRSGWEVHVVRALLGAWCEGDGLLLVDHLGELSKVAVVDQQGARVVRFVALSWRRERT